jgi:hypothetical protein
MGLLDEAIRDHLELKRRAGADPTEIARVEREALEPVFHGVRVEAQGAQLAESADGEGLAVAYEAEAVFAPPVEAQYTQPSAAPAHEHDESAFESANGDSGAQQPPMTVDEHASAFLSQETVEIDMQAVLEEDARAEAAAAADQPEPQFDWETPQRGEADPPPEPIPGQERLSFE